jgi:3-hydroxybutyryl-CoA dehydrogenase
LPETVAIIGAGPLGRWLALAAARAGFRVLLEDVMPGNLQHTRELLRREAGQRLHSARSMRASGGKNAGPLTLHPSGQDASLATAVPLRSAPDDSFVVGVNESIAGVVFASSLEDAVRAADLAIDCVPDELESKLEILLLLDRMAPPRTVLATPTTRLSITDLANCTYRPAKCIAIAAEAGSLTGKAAAGEILLRTTAKTAPETVALLEHFWRQLGFAPLVEMERAGYLH